MKYVFHNTHNSNVLFYKKLEFKKKLKIECLHMENKLFMWNV